MIVTLAIATDGKPYDIVVSDVATDSGARAKRFAKSSVAAVRSWRYPTQDQSCRHVVTVRYAFL